MAYIHCPGGTFSRYVDLPWNGVPSGATAQELINASIFIEVPAAPPAFDPATQNLTRVAPVEGPVGTWTQTWSVDAKTVQQQEDYAEQQRRENAITAIKADTEVKQLLQATPAQIDTFINNNITDLASAKLVIARIARATAVTGQFLFDN